jgi:hypothetical protein
MLDSRPRREILAAGVTLVGAWVFRSRPAPAAGLPEVTVHASPS